MSNKKNFNIYLKPRKMDKEYFIHKKSLQVDPLNIDLNFIDHLLLVLHSDKI